MRVISRHASRHVAVIAASIAQELEWTARSWMPRRRWRSQRQRSGWRPERCDRIALVLQGGGALGAYQAGVYQALHEADIEPDWVSRRFDRRHQCRDHRRQSARAAAGAAASLLGAHHRSQDLALHARRRHLPQGAQCDQLLADHDAGPAGLLRAALARTLDEPGRRAAPRPATTTTRRCARRCSSSSISRSSTTGAIRFSVGAVNVLTGNFIYFDNAEEEIGPEHVMASGALPPALPMVKIGTDYFWDGGIVSNTPLQHLLDQDDDSIRWCSRSICSARAASLPRDIQDVMARHKDIMYSSRTRHNTDVYRRIHSWKTRLYQALAKVPEDAAQRRGARAARQARGPAGDHHPAPDLSAEGL